MRIALKGGLRYLPIVGTGIQYLDFLFLKRNFSEDESSMLQAYAHYEHRRIWSQFAYVIFPGARSDSSV